MTLHLVSIGLLVLAFVIATTTPLNLGALTLVATFVIGSLVAGLPSAELFAGFPGSLFVVLVGVTYLFNVAEANGTIDWLVAGAVRMVRGRKAMIPWIMFGAAALFSGIGAVFAVPIVAPIALAFAARNRISQLYMGLMVIHGCMAGSLSPISVYGVIVNGVLTTNGFDSDPVGLFLIGFAANTVAAVLVAFVLARGRQTRTAQRGMVGAGAISGPGPAADGRPAPILGPTELPDEPGPSGGRLTLESGATLVAIGLLVVLGVVFQLDVGLLAITLTVAIGLVRPQHHKAAITAIPWSVVLLVGGVLTYVGVLEEIGTIEFLGQTVTAIGVPLAAALVLGYIGGIVSAFATSSGVIAALVPLVVPLLQTSNLDPLAVVAVLAVASTIVDVSPFSTNGAVVVANTTSDQRDHVLRNLLRYGAVVVATAPALLWAAIVLPGSLG